LVADHFGLKQLSSPGPEMIGSTEILAKVDTLEILAPVCYRPAGIVFVFRYNQLNVLNSLHHDLDMADHVVVSDEEWIQARLALLEEEKALSKAVAALAAKRAALPAVAVSDYAFVTAAGESTTLSALFEDNDDLIVYHKMPGCSMCAFFIDQAASESTYARLKPRCSYAVVSKETPDELSALIKTKGWVVPVLSAQGSTFQEDMGVAFTPEQVASKTCTYNFNRTWAYGDTAPGITVFRRDKGTGQLYKTYATFAAGLAAVSTVHSLLDLTATGRAEVDRRPMWWVKAREQYSAD